MRKHKRRQRQSDNSKPLGKVEMPLLRRHKANVVTVCCDITDSDIQAHAEGKAIIRRGMSASDNKAWHDSILWNSNVRKKWIRRMLELSDEAKILQEYLKNA